MIRIQENKWATTLENVPSNMCALQKFWSACAFTQVDKNLPRLILEGYICKTSSYRQRRLWSDCMNAQVVVFVGCACQRVHFRTLRFTLFPEIAINTQYTMSATDLSISIMNYSAKDHLICRSHGNDHVLENRIALFSLGFHLFQTHYSQQGMAV